MTRTSKAILAMISVAVALGAVWFLNRPVTPQAVTPEGVAAEAERGGYRLIDLPGSFARSVPLLGRPEFTQLLR